MTDRRTDRTTKRAKNSDQNNAVQSTGECMYFVTVVYAVCCSFDLDLDRIDLDIRTSPIDTLKMHARNKNEVSRSAV